MGVRMVGRVLATAAALLLSGCEGQYAMREVAVDKYVVPDCSGGGPYGSDGDYLLGGPCSTKEYRLTCVETTYNRPVDDGFCR